MLSVNFKPKRTAAALHGFLATAQLSWLYIAAIFALLQSSANFFIVSEH